MSQGGTLATSRRAKTPSRGAAALHGVVTNACLLACLALGGVACANFRKLDTDLEFMAGTYVVSAAIENASEFDHVYGLVIEFDPEAARVLSADFDKVGRLGVFAFFVKSARNQYVMAFSDEDGNARYDPGEPSWILTDEDGRPVPAVIPAKERKLVLRGRLSSSAALPAELMTAVREFLGTRTAREARTGWRIPIALGDIADLDDPRFSSDRGLEGLWEPSEFQRDTGVGIYFLEPYDPLRIPVLFVYGAGGSPQDWRTFFGSIDRKKYQPWFFVYPSGRRLDDIAGILTGGVELLQEHLKFPRLDVVAHSMGGLVARSFLIRNVLLDGNGYVRNFVSISTPWAGHEAAKMGVILGPAVVPSWRDMVRGSDFQKEIFSHRLKGRVDHLLLYGHRSRAVALRENDGTVTVRSQLAKPARADAVLALGFDADHVGILSLPEVIRTVQDFLGGEMLRAESRPKNP